MGTALSGSGEVLACLTAQAEPELINVSSNTVIFKGKKPKEASGQFVIKVLSVSPWSEFAGLVRIHFSPDDHYVVAGRVGSVWAYDLREKKELELPAKLKDLFTYSFDFLTADEVIGYEAKVQTVGSTRNLSLALARKRFPSGETVDTFPSRLWGDLRAAAKGNYLLAREPGQIAV